MSTLSPRLGLKRPDDTDPFVTQDFVDNYNILDAAPGIHVCTSTTRPTWGSGQAGRVIFVTDWKQLQYWSGSAWQDERTATGMFASGAVFDATVAKSTNATYNLINLTSPRPASLAIMLSLTVTCDVRFSQNITASILYDSTDVLLGGYADAMRFTGNTAESSADAQQSVTMLGLVPMTAGSHTIGGRVSVGNYNTSVVVRGLKAVAVMGTYASNQIL